MEITGDGKSRCCFAGCPGSNQKGSRSGIGSLHIGNGKGFPITVGELFGEGEEYTSNLLKSCNGGASYPLDGWEDAYDLFFASLDALKNA